MGHDPALVAPGASQASILRYSLARDDGANRILFSNPANLSDSTRPSSFARLTMTVRLSHDEGLSWSHSWQLYPVPTGYSSLAVLPDKTVACLYEWGDRRPYERIVCERFALDWLMQGSRE